MHRFQRFGFLWSACSPATVRARGRGDENRSHGVRLKFPAAYVPRCLCSPILCSPVPMFPDMGLDLEGGCHVI